VLGELALKALNSFGPTIGFELDLGNQTIMGFLDAVLEDYLTDSLYQGVGEIVSNVVEAFYTDSTFDGSTEKTLILLQEGDTYTYTSLGRADVPTIENGKIPAKLTVTFGADTATEKRFSWLTDRRVTAGTIQYMEKSLGEFDETKATEVTGETVIYGTTKGLIDVGLYAQLGYTEKARHTVELTGLKAGTEYLYRVGWPERDYWTEAFSFKTAPGSEDAPFEILLISDPQGFTGEAYERVGNLIGAAGSVFDNGYSFIINAGDLVENSRNTTQYGYYLDVLRPYMANTTQVVAAGNHDQYYFEMKDSYLPFVSSGSVYLDSYNYMLMNYNFSLPDQDTLSGAYYSYDYSGVHFTILNTNDSSNEGISAEQLEWIKADLAGTTKKHKVVVMHKSLYSAGPHIKDADIIAMRAQLAPVFEENGVNLVISGHDHTYSETFYIDSEGKEVTFANNKTDKIGNKGILYVNIGTVGNKYYKYQESEDVPVYTGAELHDPYLSNPTFGKLTFDGKDLYYQGFEYDAETDTVIEINPPFRLSTLDIILISVGSAVGAGGIGTGIFFLIKFLKKKKLAA
jgi:3',5'-cyclic AMP phosphodiesterase CpdA